MSVWLAYFLLTYFTIQFIFATIYGLIALFGTIYGSKCTISTNIYLYLQYFQQKVFNFSKISGSQTNPKSYFLLLLFFYTLIGLSVLFQLILLFNLFLLLFMVSLHFLVLFMGLSILFQLTFTFIYSIFSKKFSISVK